MKCWKIVAYNYETDGKFKGGIEIVVTAPTETKALVEAKRMAKRKIYIAQKVWEEDEKQKTKTAATLTEVLRVMKSIK